MQHPEEGIIHAWLDGALPNDEAAAIESHVASCGECAGRVAEARGLIAASSRIVGHLDAVPARVIPATPAAKKKVWLRTPWPAAIAATLVVGIGLYSTRDKATPAFDVIHLPSPEVARRVVSDPMPVAVPPSTATTPTTQRAAQPRELRPAPTARVDSVVLPPANAAAQKSAVAAAQPSSPTIATGASSQSRALAAEVSTSSAASEMLRRDRQGVAAGGVGSAASRTASGPPAAAAPAAAAERGFAASDRLADSSAFAGCYELTGVPTATPARLGADRAALPDRFAFPDRFALVEEPSLTPGLFGVRRLDAGGRPAELVVGAGWAVENGRAVVKNADGRTVFTITKTGSTVRVVPFSGSRSARVVSCR